MNNTLFCIDVYTVAEGDTLYSVSEKYDLPVSLLMKVNGISDPYTLQPGMKLCIPGDVSQLPKANQPEANQPEAKQSEAKQSEASKALKLQGFELQNSPQNQLLEILRQVMSLQQAPDERKNVHEIQNAEKTHTVKAGDTLYLIARMHNVRLEDLMDANPDTDPYNLVIGSVLRLPEQAH